MEGNVVTSSIPQFVSLDEARRVMRSSIPGLERIIEDQERIHQANLAALRAADGTAGPRLAPNAAGLAEALLAAARDYESERVTNMQMLVFRILRPATDRGELQDQATANAIIEQLELQELARAVCDFVARLSSWTVAGSLPWHIRRVLVARQRTG